MVGTSVLNEFIVLRNISREITTSWYPIVTVPGSIAFMKIVLQKLCKQKVIKVARIPHIISHFVYKKIVYLEFVYLSVNGSLVNTYLNYFC